MRTSLQITMSMLRYSTRVMQVGNATRLRGCHQVQGCTDQAITGLKSLYLHTRLLPAIPAVQVSLDSSPRHVYPLQGQSRYLSEARQTELDRLARQNLPGQHIRSVLPGSQANSVLPATWLIRLLHNCATSRVEHPVWELCHIHSIPSL